MVYNVTFPTGATCASFDIPISDDSDPEDNETFDITIMELSLPYGVERGGTDKATVTIVDNDSKWLHNYMYTMSFILHCCTILNGHLSCTTNFIFICDSVFNLSIHSCVYVYTLYTNRFFKLR